MPKKKNIIKHKSGETRKKTDFKTSVSFHEPEDDKICSSSYFAEAIVYKPQAMKQKLMIAANILLECKEEKSRLLAGKYLDGKNDPILKTLQQYTNLPTDELKQINDSITTRDRSFEKALKDVKTIQQPTFGLICDDIRNIMYKYIVKQSTFISKMDLLKDLKTVASKYTNEPLPIQRLVKQKLLKYQHLPKLNRYILMEHPERVSQRSLYLRNITEQRMLGRNFIYVEVRRIIPRSTTSGFVAGLAAFPYNGQFEKFFTKDSADLIAKKWIQQRIMPLIPQGAVVVFSQPIKRHKVSPQGKKSDMKSWLDEHGIPYENDCHTAELYNLYQRFKSKVKEQEIYDHVFLNAGFEVIHCPVEWKNLNFFKLVWSEIEIMDAYHSGRPETLKQNILNAAQMITDLDKTEQSLITNECNMLAEDRLMEDIMENLLEMVKNGEVSAIEFPKECCGDKVDNFEMHVGDIVYDVVTE